MKLKAVGNLDLSFPEQKVSLATTFKNHSGGNIQVIDYSVTESKGKEILNDLGIVGDYEGVGNLIIGYADGPAPETRPRKENYVYYID